MWDTASVGGKSTASESTDTTTNTNAKEVTPPVSPPLPTFPRFSESEAQENELEQTRRRLDQVLANAASMKPINMQYQQPISYGMPTSALNQSLDVIPRFEPSTSTVDESELSFFLDDIDFYPLDAEFLTEI